MIKTRDFKLIFNSIKDCCRGSSMSWMDIAIVIIVTITCIEGYIKGLVNSIISVGSWIVAGFLSMKFYPIAADYIIANTTLYSKINQAVNNKTSSIMSTNAVNSPVDLASVNMPKILNDMVATHTYTENTMGDVIAKLMIDISSIILIFFIVKVVLFIIALILDKFMKIPVLNQLNHFGGLIFGLLKGGIIVCVLLAILIPIIGMTNNQFITNGLESSMVAGFLYDNNIILSIIRGYFHN